MSETRIDKIKEEKERLESLKKENPDLFPQLTWIDDKGLLEKLGIFIPDKEGLPEGYLKYYPSDFIVEEITRDGRPLSIEDDGKISDEEGQTVYATLVKCGLSTLEAVSELGDLLGIPKENIHYAGIKDKEAITAQEISIRGVPKEKIENISSPQIFLKDMRTGKGVIDKGYLSGNKFSILIRVRHEDLENEKLIKNSLKAIERIKKEGFYNFYYLQRFGAPRLTNFKWAISIMQGNYERAVRGIIGDQGERESPFFLEFRKELLSLVPDWPAILEKIKDFSFIFPTETKVVEHLVKNPRDYLGALRQVEDQVTLWLSALASLLFNRKLSAFCMARIKPPKTLPLFLSQDKNDWLPYTEDLEDVGLFPLNFQNISSFRSLILKHRDIETMDMAEVGAVEIVPEGIAINFTLGKGEYATTFLSHFVTLLSGNAPEGIENEIIDVKKVLEEGNMKKTLKKFEEVNLHTK